MPRQENQKCKLLELARFLRQETDEAHGVTMQQILGHLAACGIPAERKSVYADIAALQDFGLDIAAEKAGRTSVYKLLRRDFELPELKILVDAVQSSKFLSVKKSRALIAKLEGLCSRYEARSLHRQVFVVNRVKSVNETIYYTIDAIHTAISGDKQVAFRYSEWTVEKTLRPRRSGRMYCVSPYALLWDDENYYLVAFDAEAGAIRHYRADKMAGIAVSPLAREGRQAFANVDMAVYAKGMFGMFGGEEEAVTLRFADRLVGAVIDRFGKDAVLVPGQDGTFRLHARVVVSPQFMGWVAGFGAEARILAPAGVVRRYTDFCRAMLAQYDADENA